MDNNNPYSDICVECQECCKWLTFVLDVPDRDYFTEVYEARGCTVRKELSGSRIIVMVPQTCQHLDAQLGCLIYNERPQYCKTYDGREDFFMYDKCKIPLEVPKND